MHDGIAIIVRSHDPIFAKTRLKNPEYCNFRGFVNFHCSAHYLVRAILLLGVTTTPNTVAWKHGKRELKGKGVVAFLQKCKNSNLVGKIRFKTCFGLARPFIKSVQFFFSSECVESPSALNDTKIGLILWILRESEAFEVFKDDNS